MKKLLAALLAAALLVSCAACAGNAQPSEAPSPSESPSAPASPGESAGPLFESGRDEKAVLSVSTEGESEDFEASLFLSAFGDTESPVGYSMYLIDDLYSHQLADGGLDLFTPAGYDGGDTFLDVQFFPDKTAEELKPVFMNDLIEYSDIEFSGAEKLNAKTTANSCISASDDEHMVTAYLIDTSAGVIAVTLETNYETAEGHGAKLMAMLKTIEWQKL